MKVCLNLETAVGDGKLTQPFDPESLPTGDPFTIRECESPVGGDSKSKSCITLPSQTAVSRLNNLALTAGKKRLSAQTGFLHHSYQAEEGERHDTIPLYENFCFALALLCSRQSERVLEGIAHIEKLLPFEVDGCFPLYLHEYPLCKDSFSGIHLLPVLYKIIQEFQAVIGESFKLRLERLIERILSAASKLPHALSKGAALKLQAALGEPLEIPSLSTPEQCVDALIAHQLAERLGKSSPLQEAIQAKWNPSFATFRGPQTQEKGEPKPTLFDLYMGSCFESYPKRALADHPSHLLTSLITPSSCDSSESISQAVSSTDHHIEPSSRQPYTLYFGSPNHLHSFVFDPKQGSVQIQEKEEGVEIILDLPEEYPETRDDLLACSFYLNYHADHKILINGGKGSAFWMGDSVEIHSQEKPLLSFTASLLSGEGKFCGHLLRGNRPMQSAAKGSARYEAYDWLINLRIVKRATKCRLRLLLDVPLFSDL